MEWIGSTKVGGYVGAMLLEANVGEWILSLSHVIY
jgi:hypothetical protein